MEIKLLEIRDKATFIPAMAVRISGSDGYLARRAGFGNPMVVLTHLASMRCAYDPYDWGNRTMTEAHNYIQNSWDALTDHDVVDVEWVLGETRSIKVSESLEGAGQVGGLLRL